LLQKAKEDLEKINALLQDRFLGDPNLEDLAEELAHLRMQMKQKQSKGSGQQQQQLLCIVASESERGLGKDQCASPGQVLGRSEPGGLGRRTGPFENANEAEAVQRVRTTTATAAESDGEWFLQAERVCLRRLFISIEPVVKTHHV
jgi:hypothetical protein